MGPCLLVLMAVACAFSVYSVWPFLRAHPFTDPAVNSNAFSAAGPVAEGVLSTSSLQAGGDRSGGGGAGSGRLTAPECVAISVQVAGKGKHARSLTGGAAVEELRWVRVQGVFRGLRLEVGRLSQYTTVTALHRVNNSKTNSEDGCHSVKDSQMIAITQISPERNHT